MYTPVVVYLSKQSCLCNRYTDAVSFKPLNLPLGEKKKKLRLPSATMASLKHSWSFLCSQQYSWWSWMRVWYVCHLQMENGLEKAIDRNTDLDDILSQIAELDKWREMFDARGWDICCVFINTLSCQVIRYTYLIGTYIYCIQAQFVYSYWL